MNKKDQNSFNIKNLDSGIKLYGNSPVFYHWSNSSNATKFIQRQLSGESPELIKTLDLLKERIMGLREVPVWLKSKEHIIPMNMFDIYSTLITHIKKENQEDNLFNGHEVSFIGPQGPYKYTTLVQLINQNMYQQFVYYNLLKNKLPMRNFRLFVQGHAVIKYGPDEQFSSVLDVKQMTANGILFSSKDESVLEKMDFNPNCKIIMLSENLEKIMMNGDEGSIDDLFYTTDSMQFINIASEKIIKSLSYNSVLTNEFYLFCRFSDMENTDFAEKAKEFLEYSHSIIDERKLG